MNSGASGIKIGLGIAAGTLCMLLAVHAGAQVETTKTTKSGKSTEKVRVERAEVITVDGNDLIVKMADGSVRHFENIPDTVKVTVDGKELGVQELQPGMVIQRTITTTTTPKVVTTVQTVKGKVWHVTPPLSVILTLEDGTNQSFKIPKDQKFNVNGEMVDAFALRKGMQVTAIKIVEEPMSVTTQAKSLTGTKPPVMVVSTPEAPLLIAEGAPTPVPQESAPVAAVPVQSSGPTTGTYLLYIAMGLILLVVVWFLANLARGKPRT